MDKKLIIVSLFALVLTGCGAEKTESTSSIDTTSSTISTSSSSSHAEQVIIRFLNYDEKVLYINTIPYGSNASYEGETPVRESTSFDYHYEFIGWNLSLVNITSTNEFSLYAMSFNDNCSKLF